MAAAGTVPQFASLYVGDLNQDVTEAMLYEVFNSVGPVGSIRVCRDNVTRRSLGYAYVNFHAVADAERALDTLNYSSIKGRACRIMWSQRDPSLRKSGAGNIFVKNLDRSIDNKALYDTFSLFGNILSCKVQCDREGKSQGYGFVHYETDEAAKQAIERVNGMQIGDKTVEVALFVKNNDRDQPEKAFTNLYIKNLPADCNEDKIKELFGGYGTITSSCVMADPKGRNFAFVNFESTDDAKKCVEEMHGKDLRTDEEKAKAAEDKGEDDKDEDDGKLYVQRAQTKQERARALKQQSAQREGAATSGPAGVNLYVKNLDESTDDDALKALFEQFGTTTSVSAVKDDGGKCKGFGFVSFQSPDDATKAVTEMHLKVVKGKPLYVGLAEKKEARAERLRSRYNVAGPSGGKGGKGKGGKGGPMMGKGGQMFGGPQMGGMGGGPQMGGGMMGYNPMMGMQQGQMGGGMMGKGGPMMGGPQMGGPQMMGGKGPGGPMMGAPQMMGGKGPMMGGPQMMGGKGPMPQMNPQMQQMQQMQMMQMMQQKGMQGGPQMMGKGGMPGMPGQMPGARPPAPAPQPQQPQPGGPLNASALAAAPPAVQKQMIGEKLYPAIAKYKPAEAGKITGMMLEMDNSELLMLLESEAQLKIKVDEAIIVLGGR